MNEEFLSAIGQIAEEKGIDAKKVVETIGAAIAAAYRRDFGNRTEEYKADFDPQTGKARIYRVWTVAEPIVPEGGTEAVLEKPDAQVTLEEAKKKKKDAVIGDELKEEVTPKDAKYGRIAAQTAKQVIIQKIREAEREATYDVFKDKQGEILNGTVQRIEGRNVFIDLGRVTGIMPDKEQVPGEHYRLNQRIKVFLAKVDKDPKGTDIILSRADSGIIKRLFELEVPEVYGGIVEIKDVAREPGQRSKVAVFSKQDDVDAVGSCIGQRGTRIQTIISELNQEKIDIIQYEEDAAKYIANSLSPAKVISVELDEKERKAKVHVNEDQLSLAIGKRGQNVKLAARLTGWKIDIVRTGEQEVVESSEQKAAADEAVKDEPLAETGEGGVKSESAEEEGKKEAEEK